MLRGVAVDKAVEKEGVMGRFFFWGDDLKLADEAWQGRLTAREIQLRLVAAQGDRHAKEVRRLARKLGVQLAQDQLGRKPKPYPPRQQPKRPGRPRSKVGIEFHADLHIIEAEKARKGKTPVREGVY